MSLTTVPIAPHVLQRRQGARPPQTTFSGDGSGLPWDAAIARNQVYNRIAVELLGYTPWNVALARNRYERIEKVMDSVSWIILGMMMPVMLDKLLNRAYTRGLMNRFKQSFVPNAAKTFQQNKKAISPLGLPFEVLDRARFDERAPKTQKILGQYGLKTLPKQLATRILFGKLFIIMMVDYLALAAKANIYAWGKNWMTEKLSGEKGFSGEFNYTSDKFREQKDVDYQKKKDARKKLSVILSFAGSASFPFILWGLLKSKTPAGAKGIVGKLKSIIPRFNYTDVVFLSKYALMWQVFWNWNLAGFLAARDEHERREHLTKCIAGDLFFFVGDDFISGFAAKWIQKRYAKVIGGFQFLKEKRGLFGNLEAKGLHEIFDEAAKIKNPEIKAAVIRWGRVIFGTGLLGTALGLGVSMTALNNWYTKKKVLKEQAALDANTGVQKQNTSAENISTTTIVPPTVTPTHNNLITLPPVSVGATGTLQYQL